MPTFDAVKQRQVYDRTDGYCHVCRKKLALKNYGKYGERGAWEIDHSKPQAKNGTHHLNNLLAACPSCNRSKQAKHNQVARAKHGHKAAPLSKPKAKQARAENATLGAVAGGLIGFAGGPIVALAAGAFGHAVGKRAKIQPK